MSEATATHYGAASGGATGLAGAICTLIVNIWWPYAGAENMAALVTVVSALMSAFATFAAIGFYRRNP